MTAASAALGWPTAMFSISMELIHSPPDLITSLARSVICMKPWSSMVATSPVSKKPSSSRMLAALALEIARRPRTGPCTISRPKVVAVVGQASRRRRLTSFSSMPTGGRPCFRRERHLLVVGQVRRSPASGSRQGAQRRGLGHAPGVDHVDAVLVAEAADDGLRHGRAADHHALQGGELAARSRAGGCSSICQTVGTAAEKVTPSVSSSS